MVTKGIADQSSGPECSLLFKSTFEACGRAQSTERRVESKDCLALNSRLSNFRPLAYGVADLLQWSRKDFFAGGQASSLVSMSVA